MISYNNVNEYIEKLIKLGITPDNVKTAYDNYNKSYIHYLKGEYYSAGDPRVYCSFTITNNKNTPINYDYVVELLRKMGCTNTNTLYPATGYSTGNSMSGIEPFGIIGCYADTTIKRIYFITTTGSRYYVPTFLTDKIVEI